MGAVSSGFLLFGIVLIYGMLGTLNFSLISSIKNRVQWRSLEENNDFMMSAFHITIQHLVFFLT